MHGPGPQITPYSLSAVLLYDGLLLAVDVAALWLLARRPCKRRLTAMLGAGLLLVGGIALAIAGLFRGGVFLSLGLLAHGLFGHGPLVLGGAAWLLRQERRRAATASLAAGLLLAGLAAYSFCWEPYQIEWRRLVLESDKLTRPVKIVVLADLQTDQIGEHERRVFELVARERPDLILLPGDYLQSWDDARREALARRLRALLRELRVTAPLGIYAVGGNCEGPGWTRIFAGSAVQADERTRTYRTGEIEILALEMTHSFDARLVVPRSQRFQIVMGHSPDFALGQVEAELLIAGHTHGGQVRLPFPGKGLLPLLTFCSVPREWAAGVTRLPGNRTLVVSRGVGLERGSAPRLRFLCRPELVAIELRPIR